MANFDTLSREDMVNLIQVQSAGMTENQNKIRDLLSRVEDLESKVNSSGGKRKYTMSSGETVSRRENPEKKIQDMRVKSAELEMEREAIIAFNLKNNLLPPSERLKWTKTVKLQGGNERITSLTEIKDNSSLLSLIDSKHLDVLCNSGSKYVPFNKNVIKKAWVFIKDENLVPLCRDFKGGVGVEYLWTSDEDMEKLPPSTDWIRPSKFEKDPRRQCYDPSTMKLWNPADIDQLPDAQVDDGITESLQSMADFVKETEDGKPYQQFVACD